MADGFDHEANNLQRKSGKCTTKVAPQSKEKHKTESTFNQYARNPNAFHISCPSPSYHYQGELDRIHKTQRMSNFNNEGRDTNGPHSSSHHHDQASLPKNKGNRGQEESSAHEPSSTHSASSRHSFRVQHEIDVHSIEFSFEHS